MHGVSYCTDGGEEEWTPVTGKRLKRAVPLHLLRRRAPHVEARLLSDSESIEGSDCSDVELTMPILNWWQTRPLNEYKKYQIVDINCCMYVSQAELHLGNLYTDVNRGFMHHRGYCAFFLSSRNQTHYFQFTMPSSNTFSCRKGVKV